MAEQKKREVPRAKQEGPATKEDPKPKELAKKGKKMKENIYKLLDEIDDILEGSAEEFVKNYVQRGGK